MTEARTGLRLDKWLWYARFFKTRGLAAKTVGDGHVRVNGVRAAKPSQRLVPGDVLTFVQSRAVRMVRVEALGARRGPAPEARMLYSEVAPRPDDAADAADATADRRGPRPTGRDRRDIDRLRSAAGAGESHLDFSR